jgi:hypothetical protein
MNYNFQLAQQTAKDLVGLSISIHKATTSGEKQTDLLVRKTQQAIKSNTDLLQQRGNVTTHYFQNLIEGIKNTTEQIHNTTDLLSLQHQQLSKLYSNQSK